MAITDRYSAPNMVILLSTLVNEVGGRLAGTEAGDEAAVLLQVIGHLNGVELHGGIEIAEADDQQEIQDAVERLAGVKHRFRKPPQKPGESMVWPR